MKRTFGRCLLLLPTVLWIAAVCWFEGIYPFFCIALAAAFHECGHLLAFSALGLPPPKLVPVARGVRLKTDVPLGYRQELIVALCGPAANLACTAAGRLCGGFFPALDHFGQASLMTALCNLIPMAGLDGERVLTCLIAPHVSERALWRGTCLLTSLTLFCALFASLLVLWRTGEGAYSAMLCLGAMLLSPLEDKEKRANQRKRADF